MKTAYRQVPADGHLDQAQFSQMPQTHSASLLGEGGSAGVCVCMGGVVTPS